MTFGTRLEHPRASEVQRHISRGGYCSRLEDVRGFHCCVLRLICVIREVTTIGAEDFRSAVHHSHTGVCARTITSPEDRHRVDSGITRLFCPVGITVDIVRGTCGGGTWSHSLRAKVALAYNSGFVLKSGTVSVSDAEPTILSAGGCACARIDTPTFPSGLQA